MLKLFFLGPPRVELDSVPLEFESRKGLALLIYLAVTGETHSRDGLSTLLWPDFDQSRARSYLRHALWSVKKALGETCLDISRELVGLNPAAERGHPLSTIELLRGMQKRGDLYQDEAGVWQMQSALNWTKRCRRGWRGRLVSEFIACPERYGICCK